ncbi:MAG: ABC transporter permease [Bacteroidales bacterium]|nr:ABC transporter permease [Bacteroidales bacterium]
MFKNFLTTAFRSLLKNKLFSLINIFGLAIGLACFTMIILYVQDELSYDKHHDHAENIYRLSLKGSMTGNNFHTATSGGPVGELMQNEIPEVEEHVTLYKSNRPVLFQVDDHKFYQDGIMYADSNFFNIFKYEFINGDPVTALNQPNSLVLSETMAGKFFGNRDPMFQTIRWNNEQNMIVKGVVRDPVNRSHLHFDVLASMSTFRSDQRMWSYMNSLWTFITQNYVRVSDGTTLDILNEKIKTVAASHLNQAEEEYGLKLEIVPQPITDIHLTSKLVHELGNNGDMSRIWIFSTIAFLVLVVACINFVNLTTAKSSRRALEVGVRKVFGASRNLLFRQFISESLIIALISLFISMFLVELFLPFFVNLAGVEFGYRWLANWPFLLFLLGVALLAGLLSGSYPAVFLSAYKPIRVLKGDVFRGGRRSYFRNAMVVLQFVISVFLIFSTLAIYRQLQFMQSKDIGISREDVVIVPIRGSDLMAKYENMQDEFRLIPGVKDVSASSTYLGNFEQRRGYYPEGTTRQSSWMMNNVQVDYNYLDMMNTELLMGRNFNENRQLDSNAIIINEALMKKLEWENPLGRFIYLPFGETAAEDTPLKIVGVVRDFNFASLHDAVEPLLIQLDPSMFRYLNIKISRQNVAGILGMIESKWQEFSPDQPFDYFFQDTRFDSFYVAEIQMTNLFIYFSVLALFIAAIGLFGLALYTTERRTKEIGIRKVFGGSVQQILKLLTREFIRWVIIANLIAWPLAWYFMHIWLQNFAYQTNISWWIFALSAIFSLLIALITVSWQSIRATLKNPVEALRWE